MGIVGTFPRVKGGLDVTLATYPHLMLTKVKNELKLYLLFSLASSSALLYFTVKGYGHTYKFYFNHYAV
jgi:hypothetical protein